MKLLSLAGLYCLATLGVCMSASLKEALAAFDRHLDGEPADMEAKAADSNKELTGEGDNKPVEAPAELNMQEMRPNVPDAFVTTNKEAPDPNFANTLNDAETVQYMPLNTSLPESPAAPNILLQNYTEYPAPISIPLHPDPEPCHCGTPCCDMRKTKISLRSNKPYVINNLFDSVVVLQKPTVWYPKMECSRTALLKVRFERITPNPDPNLCISNMYCGKRMLRIDLELSSSYRSFYNRRMFNIGDSITNNGYGGDAGTQNYDAEIDAMDNSFRVYGSDHCETRQAFVFPDALASNVKRITIWVSQGYMRVKNYQGCDEEMCMPECLFALNGQTDTTINQDIYIALNRVVSGIHNGNGWGVCSAVLSWACPFPRDSPDNKCDIQ